MPEYVFGTVEAAPKIFLVLSHIGFRLISYGVSAQAVGFVGVCAWIQFGVVESNKKSVLLVFAVMICFASLMVLVMMQFRAFRMLLWRWELRLLGAVALVNLAMAFLAGGAGLAWL